MIMHPAIYKKQYYDLVREIEESINISPTDPMYNDRLDEAYNAMSDDLMADFSGRPLS